MTPIARFTCSVVVMSCLAAAASTAAGTAPVRVNHCEPIEGTTMVSGGYVPGYYPGAGPYYWRDPYGYRYHQFATPTVTSTAPELKIDFVNVTPDPLKEVEFGLVARGHLIAEVRDVGTFSQGVEIKHKFGLNPNVFPIGTGLPQCVPMRATYHNGTVWTSPHLPALQRSLYE